MSRCDDYKGLLYVFTPSYKNANFVRIYLETLCSYEESNEVGLTVLADQCKDGKKGIFLWEDPELFMHSKSLCRLVKEVVEIVKDKPIQVFISTQSLEVIAFFVRVLKEKQELQDKIRAFHMKLVDDELITAHFKYSNLDAWFKHGLDLRFWDQMDVIMHYQIEESDQEDEE